MANRLAGTTSKILDGGKLAEAGSRNLAIVSLAINAAEVVSTKQLKALNAVNGVITGISIFFPVAGKVYFVADLLVEGLTGESIGEHIDAAWGEPIYDF